MAVDIMFKTPNWTNILAISLIVMPCVGCVASARTQEGEWIVEGVQLNGVPRQGEDWSRIQSRIPSVRIGMSEVEVIALLGDPAYRSKDVLFYCSCEKSIPAKGFSYGILRVFLGGDTVETGVTTRSVVACTSSIEQL